MGVLDALEAAVESVRLQRELEEKEEREEKGVRRVRTPEGVRHYHAPIGTPIIAHPEVNVPHPGRSSGGRGSAGESGGRPGASTRSRPGGRVQGTTAQGNAVAQLDNGYVPLADRLKEPLTPAFQAKYDKARAGLPDDPASWFPAEDLTQFHRDWRRMDGSPGPKALDREERIRAVGKVVDAEVLRRMKLIDVLAPLTEQQRARVRKERDKVWKEYDEGKWSHMEEVAVRLFGPRQQDYGDRWSELDGDQIRQVIDTIHTEHPELKKLNDKGDELLGKLITSEASYHIAYSIALEDVMRQLRPMGGELDVGYAFDGEVEVPKDVAAGPNSGVIPYQWRYAGPHWNTRDPRPVNIDRQGMRDYNRLTPHVQKLARTELRKLEQGKAKTEEKMRGQLAGTWGVRLDNDSRMLIYPHVDGTWHIYAILPSHDYHEAERRMSDRPVGVGGRRDLVAADMGGPPALRRDAPILHPDNAQYLTEKDQVRVAKIRDAQGAMAVASSRYPASWVALSNAGKPFDVGQSDWELGRGYYRETSPLTSTAPDQLMLGPDLTEERVAVHELAHRMERVVPWIRAAEWTFLWRRTSKPEVDFTTPDTPEGRAAQIEVDSLRDRRRDLMYTIDSIQTRLSHLGVRTSVERNQERLAENQAQLKEVEAQLKEAEKKLRALQNRAVYLQQREWPAKMNDIIPGGGFKDHERARPDKFITAYVGKDYGDSPTSSYEVMSMGMEGLWTGSRNMWEDPEHRHLVLGLLAAG